MKAVILNSGIGKRMGRLTEDRPKCLVEVGNGDTILSRQVGLLTEQNIDRFLITTGPFENKLKEYMERRFPRLKVEYVHNPRYAHTNYIYSLLVAREHLNEDILLLHGDLVFEAAVLKKLLDSGHENAVLVNRAIALPEKDFKGRIIDGLVKEISVNIFDENCAFLVPMYRLTAAVMKDWLQEMESFAREGNLKVYAEDALNKILDRIPLFPVYYESEFCMEIDNPEDLALAQKELSRLKG